MNQSLIDIAQSACIICLSICVVVLSRSRAKLLQEIYRYQGTLDERIYQLEESRQGDWLSELTDEDLIVVKGPKP